jgi:hypothetical protein
MVLKSKIIIFLITLLIAFSFITCKKSKYDVIPDVYVDFYLDLNDIVFKDLYSVSNFVIITSKTPSTEFFGRLVGYNNNGIIVLHATEEEFYAFDRTCPYDFAVNGLSIAINVDGFDAVCPQCSTKYSLYGGGAPLSGIGNYPLKAYKTALVGQIVHIWHH